MSLRFATSGSPKIPPEETLMLGDTTQDESPLSEETLMLGDTTQDESPLSEETLMLGDTTQDESSLSEELCGMAHSG